MFFYGEEALAKENTVSDSIFQYSLSKVAYLSNMNVATIEKNQNWVLNSFDSFRGNNLQNNFVTSETNEIQITRSIANYSKIYELSITDMNWGKIYGSTTIYRGILNGNIQLNAKFEPGNTYVVLVREFDPWGQLTGKNYPIGYFGTAQTSNPQVSKPKINEVTDKDTTIFGTATPNTTVHLTIGTDKYRGTTATDGSFSINLDHSYPAGTGLEVYTMDSTGGKSESLIGIVKGANDTIGVNPIYSSDSVITGKTIPNVLVEASIDNSKVRARIYEGTSDSQGYFSIDLNGKTYPAGTQVTITAFKSDGTNISKLVIVYPRIPSVNTVNINDTVITGSADPNAKLEVLINNIDRYRTTVDAAGNFRVVVDPLKLGDKLSIYQESNGINSDTVSIIVK